MPHAVESQSEENRREPAMSSKLLRFKEVRRKSQDEQAGQGRRHAGTGESQLACRFNERREQGGPKEDPSAP